MNIPSINPKDDPKLAIMKAVKSIIGETHPHALPFVAQRVSIDVAPDKWSVITNDADFVTMAENYAQQVSKVMNTWTEEGFDISVIQWSLPSLNIQLN